MPLDVSHETLPHASVCHLRSLCHANLFMLELSLTRETRLFLSLPRALKPEKRMPKPVVPGLVVLCRCILSLIPVPPFSDHDFVPNPVPLCLVNWILLL